MPKTLFKHIFNANKLWVEKMKMEDPLYFEKLAKVQKPEYLYIGCSDSRVHANEIMGLEPGQVFVHRNIANLVTHTDMNVQAVIHYAVEYLKVKYIVICGHYNCGGVKAAMEAKDMGILNPWLRNIRDVYRNHEKELEAIDDIDSRYNRLVELNIYEQCINVIKTAEVQKSYIENKYPLVVGWVYDINQGYIRDLEIDFEKELGKTQKIYDLSSGNDTKL